MPTTTRNSKNKSKNPIVYPHLQDQQLQIQKEGLTTTGSFSQEQIQLLSTLPFWINDPTEHANIYDNDPDRCCFNHYVGLPEIDGERYPLFDYQVHEQYKGQPG